MGAPPVGGDEWQPRQRDASSASTSHGRSDVGPVVGPLPPAPVAGVPPPAPPIPGVTRTGVVPPPGAGLLPAGPPAAPMSPTDSQALVVRATITKNSLFIDE